MCYLQRVRCGNAICSSATMQCSSAICGSAVVHLYRRFNAMMHFTNEVASDEATIVPSSSKGGS